MTPPDFTAVALTVTGAFYTFAGYVATRAGLQARLMDIAISAIDLQTPKPAETARALWMVLAGLFILAGGLALLLRTDLAALLFAVSALAQGLYLYVIAPRYLDPSDPIEPGGRRQTSNAFTLYLLATAFVLWAYAAGHLYALRTVPWPLLPLAVTGTLAFAAYALYRFAWPLSK